jgi:hypothetical protein
MHNRTNPPQIVQTVYPGQLQGVASEPGLAETTVCNGVVARDGIVLSMGLAVL